MTSRIIFWLWLLTSWAKAAFTSLSISREALGIFKFYLFIILTGRSQYSGFVVWRILKQKKQQNASGKLRTDSLTPVSLQKYVSHLLQQEWEIPSGRDCKTQKKLGAAILSHKKSYSLAPSNSCLWVYHSSNFRLAELVKINEFLLHFCLLMHSGGGSWLKTRPIAGLFSP